MDVSRSREVSNRTSTRRTRFGLSGLSLLVLGLFSGACVADDLETLLALVAPVKQALDEHRYLDMIRLTDTLDTLSSVQSQDSVQRGRIAYLLRCRGFALLQMGELESSATAYESSMEWTPFHTAATQLNRIWTEMEQYERIVSASAKWADQKLLDPDVLAEMRDHAELRLMVQQGDQCFLKGKRAEARQFYEQALDRWDKMPVSASSREQWKKTAESVGGEYTYVRDYDPETAPKTKLLEGLFAREKLDILEWEETHPGAVTPERIHRAAGVIVRGVDVTWADEDGHQLHTVTKLDDAELDRIKRGWLWAMRAVEAYSHGRVKIQTEFFDFPDMVLTGVTQARYKGLIPTRHLDPNALRPLHADFFAAAGARFDTFVFLWDGGTMALAYGGGPIVLPGVRPAMRRGGIKRLSPLPNINFHEFRHNIDGFFKTPFCHGFREPDWPKPPGYTGKSEGDYHRYVFEHYLNPQGWKHFGFVQP